MGVRLKLREKLREWYTKREIPQSGMMISDVKQGKNWMRRGHRRSLGTESKTGK